MGSEPIILRDCNHQNNMVDALLIYTSYMFWITMIHELGHSIFTHCQQFPKLMVECECFDLDVLLDRNHDLHAESVEEHLT